MSADRVHANAADLAADYKARGIKRTRAWSQFVIDRALRPEIDAKAFSRLYDGASPCPLPLDGDLISDGIAEFRPTHIDLLLGVGVMLSPTDSGHLVRWSASRGSEPGPLSARYQPIGAGPLADLLRDGWCLVPGDELAAHRGLAETVEAADLAAFVQARDAGKPLDGRSPVPPLWRPAVQARCVIRDIREAAQRRNAERVRSWERAKEQEKEIAR